MTATFLISLGYTAEADRLTVVDDVRFLNEAEAVRRHGGIMGAWCAPASMQTHSTAAKAAWTLTRGLIM